MEGLIMWCVSCGSHLAPGARFCGSCGTAVSQDAARDTRDTGARSFQAEPRVIPAAGAAASTSLSEAWAQLKLWRVKMVLGPIEDRASARTLVVAGAFGFAANAAFAFVGALTNPILFVSGLMGIGLAAALWYANSRIAAAFGVFAFLCGLAVTMVTGAWANPLALLQISAMGVVAIGAARGAFALQGSAHAAPLSTTQTSLS